MTMHPVTLTRKNLPASSRRTSRLPLALGAALALMLTLGASSALAKGPDGGYTQRNGGYTRILRLGTRVGDAAPACIIQLVEAGAPAAKKETKKEVKKEEAAS